MKAKNVKLEMVSLAWCESTKGLKKKEVLWKDEERDSRSKKGK